MTPPTPVESWSDGGALFVRLSRPEKLNALDWSTVDQISGLLDRAEADDAVRAVVLTGAGRAFSAGADIEAIATSLDEPEVAVREFVQRGQRLTLRIEQFPKPVLAAVNGLAFGGGCEIVEACHLAVAGRSATFAKPEIHLGFPPTWGGTQRLPRLIGRKRAMAMILSGEPISAEEAADVGLINEVVPDEALMDTVVGWVSRIRAHGAPAVAACLTAVTRGAQLPIEEALAVEAGEFLRVAWRAETSDAVGRFLARKREPRAAD